jgi:hypothetical protein
MEVLLSRFKERKVQGQFCKMLVMLGIPPNSNLSFGAKAERSKARFRVTSDQLGRKFLRGFVCGEKGMACQHGANTSHEAVGGLAS